MYLNSGMLALPDGGSRDSASRDYLRAGPASRVGRRGPRAHRLAAGQGGSRPSPRRWIGSPSSARGAPRTPGPRNGSVDRRRRGKRPRAPGGRAAPWAVRAPGVVPARAGGGERTLADDRAPDRDGPRLAGPRNAAVAGHGPRRLRGRALRWARSDRPGRARRGERTAGSGDPGGPPRAARLRPREPAPPRPRPDSRTATRDRPRAPRPSRPGARAGARGGLRLRGGRPALLARAGDSLLFEASQPHRALNPGSRPARVLLALYAPEEEPGWIESHVTPGNPVQAGKRRSS